MVLEYDPDVAVAMTPILEAMAKLPKLAVGDVVGRRKLVRARIVRNMSQVPTVADVTYKDNYATTPDGHSLLLRWITKDRNWSEKPSDPGPAVVYAHAGGMILGDVPLYTKLLSTLVSQSSVPMLAVEFRNAPESRGPQMAEDCLNALEWLHSHAQELQVDPARIAIMGDSGGGGVAAATCLLARDLNLNPPIAKQILIHPMLDYCTTVPDPSLVPVITWSYDDNITSWSAVLGKTPNELEKLRRSDPAVEISPYASPARAKDLQNLPPTYIEVGNLDIFRDEDIEYARRLALADVSTELHVRAGCPHGFIGIAPKAKVTNRARLDQLRALQSF